MIPSSLFSSEPGTSNCRTTGPGKEIRPISYYWPAMVSPVLHAQDELFDWIKAWPNADVQGAWLGLSFPPTYSSSMNRAFCLLARSRRFQRVPSASAVLSGEAATLPRCAPNVVRMVSGHLGPGLPAVTFMSVCPGCPRGPRPGSAPADMRSFRPGRCLQPGVLELRAAQGRRAPGREHGCQGRPTQYLSL